MSTHVNQVLKEMAQLTAVTGRISSVQEQNLKMFPLIFFNDIETINVVYDLSPIKSEGSTLVATKPMVSYYLTLDESKNENLPKRFLALEKSIATLFWSGIVLEVFFNDILKYRSN